MAKRGRVLERSPPCMFEANALFHHAVNAALMIPLIENANAHIKNRRR
jgi:hypothetical protein